MGTAQVLLTVGHRVCLNPSVGTWEGPALGLWWSRSRFQIRPIHWVVQGRRQTEHWGRGLDWSLRREWGTERPRQMGGHPVSQAQQGPTTHSSDPTGESRTCKAGCSGGMMKSYHGARTVHGEQQKPAKCGRVVPRNLPLHTFLRTTLYPCLWHHFKLNSPFRIWGSRKVLGVLRRKPCPDPFESEFSSHSQAMESQWLWDPDFVYPFAYHTDLC